MNASADAFRLKRISRARERSRSFKFGYCLKSSVVVVNGSMKVSDLLGWPFWVGLMIGWVVMPIVNFTVNSLWVFRAKAFFTYAKPGDTDV